MLISVVIPVYNSSSSLRELAERLIALGDRLEAFSFEIIFVDDGSQNQETWTTLRALSEEYPQVVAVQLTRNFGQQSATLCGLAHSRGGYAITMDDDLQHDPEDIPKLLKEMNHDIVIGQIQKNCHSKMRRFSSYLKGIFERIIIGKPSGIRLSSFRLMNRVVVNGILAIHTPNPFIPAMMFSVSQDVVGVPITHSRRVEGRSGYNLFRRLLLFSNLLINNSSLVLRLVGYLGIGFSAISFLVLAGVLYKKFAYGTAISGWTSLIGTLLLIGGLLLFGLGVVGEYLIRIVETAESKPTYFVRKIRSASLPINPAVKNRQKEDIRGVSRTG